MIDLNKRYLRAKLVDGVRFFRFQFPDWYNYTLQSCLHELNGMAGVW